MYISDDLYYLELHKTGCSHIRKLLSEFLIGKEVGKHNRLRRSLFDRSKPVVASIRCPYEWYTSLWRYGCDGRGDLYYSLCKPKFSIKGLGLFSKPSMFLNRYLISTSREPEFWQRLYDNPSDAGAFREWLKAINDPDLIVDLSSGYGVAPFNAHSGLLSYRFLTLFSTYEEDACLVDSFASYAEADNHYRKSAIVKFFIRNEFLEDDFVSVLESIGVEISNDQVEAIKTRPKTNISSLKKSLDFYFDSPSRDIVLGRDKLIFDLFDY